MVEPKVPRFPNRVREFDSCRGHFLYLPRMSVNRPQIGAFARRLRPTESRHAPPGLTLLGRRSSSTASDARTTRPQRPEPKRQVGRSASKPRSRVFPAKDRPARRGARQALTEVVQDLEHQRGAGMVPWFDPTTQASMPAFCSLFEAPGPRATGVAGPRPGECGSGFISLDNNDCSAETTWRLFDELGVNRSRDVVFWSGSRTTTGPGNARFPPLHATRAAASSGR